MPKGNIPQFYSYDREEEVGTMIPLMNKPCLASSSGRGAVQGDS